MSKEFTRVALLLSTLMAAGCASTPPLRAPICDTLTMAGVLSLRAQAPLDAALIEQLQRDPRPLGFALTPEELQQLRATGVGEAPIAYLQGRLTGQGAADPCGPYAARYYGCSVGRACGYRGYPAGYRGYPGYAYYGTRYSGHGGSHGVRHGGGHRGGRHH
ncbi:MAG: hypothetical protein Q8L99_04155 [Polycyclovorans sp.]|nr:hypothetical protein [Gammaproteobacteria bacterium]MDP1542323.1 hypothetical protein [Polycyclovorans sp.]